MTRTRISTHAFEDKQILKLQVSIFISEILSRTYSFADGRVVVRIPVNDKVTSDIEFPSDIPRRDFCDRVMAAMDLDRTTALLGWKTSDEAKRAAAHELTTDSDVDNAFKAILDIQNNPRRKKEIILEIVHLVCLSFIIPQINLIVHSESSTRPSHKEENRWKPCY